MKIALVFDGLQIGGIERVGADYSKILNELGHNVDVINLNPNLNSMSNEFISINKVFNFYFPRKICPEQYAQLIKRFYLGRFVYPFISIFLDSFLFFYKYLFKIIFINKCNYDLVIAFSGHFNDLTFVSKNFIKTRNKMCWLHGALYSYLLCSDGYLNLYKKIKNLIVLVDDAQEEVLHYNKFLTLNINKLYNPSFIKSKEINLNKVNDLKNKYGNFFVMISRFQYPHKDHYTVVKAFEIIHKEYNMNVNILFIGSGQEENKVKEFVEKNCTYSKEHIFFLGSQNDVQNYYSAAYGLVHASVAGEGLPTILLEAMAFELPIVVTDSKTGPREILGNDEFGLLCKVEDPRDMANKIIMLYKDKELYNHYHSCESMRIKDFSPQTIKKQLSNILKNNFIK